MNHISSLSVSEVVIQEKDNAKKCSHETKSNLSESRERVEKMGSYSHIRKKKSRQQDDLDENFVEPDVDLPDLESVSGDDHQLSTQKLELKVQPAVSLMQFS